MIVNDQRRRDAARSATGSRTSRRSSSRIRGPRPRRSSPCRPTAARTSTTFADKALAAGGSPANEPMDMDFMYGAQLPGSRTGTTGRSSGWIRAALEQAPAGAGRSSGLMRRALQRSGERIVRANGVDLCVETFGDPRDPAILLIGGAASSMDWWHDGLCERLAGGAAVRRPLRPAGHRAIGDLRARQAAVPGSRPRRGRGRDPRRARDRPGAPRRHLDGRRHREADRLRPPRRASRR